MRHLTVVLVLLACCARPTPDRTREESARLRHSFEKYRTDYQNSIATENTLATETIAWLKDEARTAPRSLAVMAARKARDRWGLVYFVPRHMHQQLRADSYTSPQVRDVHQKVLDHLKRRYFELHDYQRYAQYASESEMHHTPAGKLPPQLTEFLARLEKRRPAVDEVWPALNSLPR